MTGGSRRIVVTGAGGFIGAALTRRLLSNAAFAGDRFTLCDLSLPDAPPDPRVRCVEGDFAEAEVRRDLLRDGADIVFHLASVLGGAAEANYDLARRVNLDATLSLLEALRDPARPPRVVYASSIAVFGAMADDPVDDDTPAFPTMVYGAQKRMIEVVLEQFSARGWIDGVAPRLPGVVARPDADARLKSAFLNTVFHEVAAGRDIVLPVSRDGTTWMISIPVAVEALVHAALLPRDRLGARRAFTLPAQRVSFDALIAALKRRYPQSRSTVAFAPDAEIEAQFARQPVLTTALGDLLGFRHDGDLDALVRQALAQAAAS